MPEKALRLRHRRRRLGRAARWPTGSPPTPAPACWCWRPAARTSGSTRSSTCRPRCRSRSATAFYDWRYESEPEPHMGGRQDLPRPRQGARRLVQHQRDDLPAGQPAGLRALGRRQGHGELELRALPALLQADGDLPGRRRRVARRQRPADPGARPGDQPAVRRVLRGRAAGRLPAHRRRQRLPAGGLRPVRPQRAPRPAAVRGAGLPAPGHGPAQPDRAHPGAGHEGDLRRHPGDRGRVPARAPQPPGVGPRGDPLRRRDQLPAAAAAVRRGQRRRAGRAGHPGGGRPARGGRAPAGPPRGLHPVRVQAAGVDRARAALAGPAADRRRVAVPAARVWAPPTTSRAAASCAATTTSTTRT